MREQVKENLAGEAWTLVPMMMAVGGAEPEHDTMKVLRKALRDKDETTRSAAEYAEAMAKELLDDPAVMRVEVREMDEVLRTAQPVDGEEDWVTVRPGVPGRAVPRPVAWLRFSGGPDAPLPNFIWDQDWSVEVASKISDDWYDPPARGRWRTSRRPA